jgi:geranylgeranyl diphosphate synthase type II
MPIKIEKLSALVGKEIEQLSLGDSPKQLYDPLYYILSLGGKRIRPLLALIGYSLYKDDAHTIIDPALAVEVFHNFTLMHDDIMDEAPLRRGESTVHEKWDTNVAILSGDVMMVRAYDLFLGLKKKQFKKSIAMFNECARLVCEGQQLDMNFESQNKVSEAAYLEMIKLKTAVLLGFSLKLGAYLADASDSDCDALDQFGIGIGIGFQLKDDLLDVYGDQKEVGKQVGGDIIANKKTFLLIKALELANQSQLKVLNEWISKKTFDPIEKVKAITDIYNELDIEELTEVEMNKQFNLAFASLQQVNASKPKVAVLKKFSEQLINREK